MIKSCIKIFKYIFLNKNIYFYLFFFIFFIYFFIIFINLLLNYKNSTDFFYNYIFINNEQNKIILINNIDIYVNELFIYIKINIFFYFFSFLFFIKNQFIFEYFFFNNYFIENPFDLATIYNIDPNYKLRRRKRKLTPRQHQYFDRYFFALGRKVIHGLYNPRYNFEFYMQYIEKHDNNLAGYVKPLKNLSIHNTDVVSFIYFYIKKVFLDLLNLLIFVKQKLNDIFLNFYFINYINKIFKLIYYYLYIFFKYIFLFIYIIYYYLFFFIENIFNCILKQIPEIYIWCFNIDYFSKINLPKNIPLNLQIIRIKITELFFFDFFNSIYSPKEHYINLFNFKFKLEFKGISFFIFDWINIEYFISSFFFIKKIFNIYLNILNEIAGITNNYLNIAIFESIEKENKQLNIFKLMDNLNFYYFFFGTFFLFIVHCPIIEFIFIFYSYVYDFCYYWYWRYLKRFGSEIQKFRANYIIANIDAFSEYKEAKEKLKELNSVMFSLFKGLEESIQRKIRNNPSEAIILSRFIDLEFRENLINIFIGSLHEIDYKFNKKRKLTEFEEYFSNIQNRGYIEDFDELNLRIKKKSNNIESNLKKKIEYDLIFYNKYIKNLKKVNMLFYLKKNPKIEFTDVHIKLLLDIYKNDLIKEFNIIQKKDKNIKK